MTIRLGSKPQNMNPQTARIGTANCGPAGCAVNKTHEASVSSIAINATDLGAQDSALVVSVIVPCRNEAKSIHAFLNSLLNQDLEGIPWEVIIADGMSVDGTRDVLLRFSKEHPQIRMIDNPRRIASTGLNACIRAARGDILIRMDVHTEYKSDYIRRCVEVLKQTKAANVGGACVAVQSGYVGRAIAGAFHSSFAVGGAQWHQTDYEGPADTVHLGCWRREVLEQAGCFDETLVRNQDDELNLRLRRAGGTIWQSPRIVSWYHPRSSLGALFRQYFQYGYWKVAVIRKHRLPASWRHLVPGSFVLGNIVVFAAALFGVIFGRGPLSWFTMAGMAADIVYAAAVMAASGAVARKTDWRLFAVLPLVFFCFHVGYGLGFLYGIWHFGIVPRNDRYEQTAFTELTR